MKAIVLCAGYGTRLGDLTREIPKPMLMLGDYPLIHYTMKYLTLQGFDDIGINLHYRPELIKDYLGSGERYGANIEYRYEEKLLGTAGALGNFKSWLTGDESFLVIYGDILTDQLLLPIFDFHLGSEAFSTILLHKRNRSNSIVSIDDNNRIIKFIERPSENEKAAGPLYWVNSGVQFLHRKVLDYIPEGGTLDLPKDIYIPLLKDKLIQGYPLCGYRCAIDSKERYEEVRNAILSGEYNLGKIENATEK